MAAEYTPPEGQPATIEWRSETIAPTCGEYRDILGLLDKPAIVNKDACNEIEDADQDGCLFTGAVGVDDALYSRDVSWSSGGDHMFSNQNLQPGTELEFGSNKGCHIGTMNVGLCEHAGIIWLMMIITLAASITGSVMGCCVVCCGNDVDKSDDSG
eukprot:COSAG06_NODE_2640_length_6527_cov_67.332141_3_plen_156_part_00